MNLIEIRNKINSGYSLYDLNLRVTFYARVSTEDLRQINSLNNQASYFKDMIINNSNWIYVDGYVDEGISGTSVKHREEFMRMIDDAKDNKFDLIVTKEISRFSRNTLDSIKYTRWLLNYGVIVLFLNDNINTALSDSELRLTIMASMAQDEIRRLSERVKFGMKRSIEKGIILGNNLIYGYDKSQNKLIINQEEALIVNKIFNDYVKDSSVVKIADNLNKLNVKTKLGGKWSATSISRIIRNPKYKGYYCGNKSEVIDYMSKKIFYHDNKDWIIYEDFKIPVIVTKELWDKANNKINRRNKCEKNKFLFNKKIYCKNCGFLYYGRMQKSRVTYMCNNYLKNGKSFCKSSIIYQDELFFIFKKIFNLNYRDSLMDEISKLYGNYDDFKVLFDDDFISYFINIYLDKVIVSNDYDLDIYLNDSIYYQDNFYFNRGSKYSKKYRVYYKVETK